MMGTTSTFYCKDTLELDLDLYLVGVPMIGSQHSKQFQNPMKTDYWILMIKICFLPNFEVRQPEWKKNPTYIPLEA